MSSGPEKAGQQWFELNPQDGFFLPAGTPPCLSQHDRRAGQYHLWGGATLSGGIGRDR